MLSGSRSRWLLASIVVLAALLVVVGVRRSGGPEASSPELTLASVADSPGAAALLDPEHHDVRWSEVDSITAVRPLPRDAKKDRPALYDDGSGCQIWQGDPVPKVCTSGDKGASRSLMLVGDSKIAQWQTAFSNLGKQEGWQVLTTTKSGCAFTDATMTGGGKILDDCRQWGRATLRDVLAARPDVVVTSQVHDTALDDPRSSTRHRSKAAMIRGLQSYWRQLQKAGITVVVLLDNPMPTSHPTYQCVQDHPTQLTRCAFSLAGPLRRSAAPMQLAAAAATPGVGVIDMAPTYCPGLQVCPAVIGNVLLYRAGSHLTKAFTVSAEPQLSAELARATDGRFGSTTP